MHQKERPLNSVGLLPKDMGTALQPWARTASWRQKKVLNCVSFKHNQIAISGSVKLERESSKNVLARKILDTSLLKTFFFQLASLPEREK